MPRRGGKHTSWGCAAAWLLAEYLALAGLLFLTRFVARGHLALRTDQECHIGGIAVDVMAHGIRFPFAAYSPNEYDNGSFFSGLLTAVSFRVLGQSVLSLKLVTHAIATGGTLAALWLLRRCLDDLGVTRPLERWTAIAALVIAAALGPRLVTMVSMYGVGNHAEGTAIDVVLMALFVWRLRSPSKLSAAVRWALVGLALYVNKGTVLVLPVLTFAEIFRARRSPGRLVAAGAGLMMGALPEILVIVQRHGLGWATITGKAERNSGGFPGSFLGSVAMLGEHRIELLGVWALAIGVALVSAFRSRSAPLGILLGFLGFHMAALTVMAQGGLDAYAVYAYPTLVVLFAVTVALSIRGVASRWGGRASVWAACAAMVLTAVLYRPEVVTWDTGPASALWHEREGAACSWRFAEGFGREYRQSPSQADGTRDDHVIERCRSLSDDQGVDCIGGVARELHWRRGGRVTSGEPPAQLDERERRAYAFHYGIHRRGEVAPCGDFTSADLQATCADAVRLDCLVFGDLYSRIATGRGFGQPRCTVAAPPMHGYWESMRRDLITRGPGVGANLNQAGGDLELAGCQAIFEQCY